MIPDEDDDSERTVVRPAARAKAPVVAPPPETDAPMLPTPLGVAASPLLQLLAHLPLAVKRPAPDDISDRVVRELRTFERRAREAGVPMDLVRPVHFALCATLDEVLFPGGRMVAMFHRDNRLGVPGALARLRENPEKYQPAIEVMSLCLALGSSGNDTSAANPGIATPPPARIQRKGTRGRTMAPLWAAAAVSVLAIAGAWAWIHVGINNADRDLAAAFASAPPTHMPAIVRPE